jgi:hypothetical protein
VAQVIGDELGWSKRRVGAEAKEWVQSAAEEGIDPAG